MGKMLSRTLLLLLLCLPSFAAAALVVEPGIDRYLGGPELYYLVDENNELLEADVLAGKYAAEFKRSPESVLNLGFSDASIWIRLDVEFSDKLSKERSWLLEIGYPLLDEVAFYRMDGDQFRKTESGDTKPFSQRELNQPNFAFRLPIFPGNTSTYYLKIRSSSSLQIPITLWSTEAYADKNGQKLIVLGAFYGIMLVMILYNFFIFLSIRNAAYLYYILYITSFTLFLASLNGLTFQYLWPDSPAWGNVSIPFFISLAGTAATLFTKKFLDTQTVVPVLDKLLSGLFGVFVISVGISLFAEYAVAIRVGVLFAIVFGAVVLLTGSICLYRGLRIARFFLLAWITLLLGIMIHAITSLGLLPINAITLYADQTGCAIEVILLSFALADRINSLRVEKELFQRQALAVLKKNNKVKDEFLATISHELRTPMNGIMNAMQLIRYTRLDEEQDGLVHIASQSSGNMLTLIDNILGFTEAQAGSLELKEEPFPTRELLDLLVARFSSQCADKNLQFAVNLDESVPPCLEGDEDKLYKLLGYILDNSVKFTDSGTIELTVTLDDRADNDEYKWIKFDIVDSGVGIDEKRQQDIFEVFQQADGSYSRRFGGLGIGLSIAKQVNALMGGTIKLESELGAGTHVSLSIPMKEGILPLRAVEGAEDLKPADTRILIVEDNQTNQIILKKTLEKLGFNALIAENGQEALDVITQYQPHAILMDCQMPVMDGFKATQAIRNMGKPYRDLPIIAVTANVMSGDKQRCLESGMDDYIKKPANREIINNKLTLWIQHRKSEYGVVAA